MTAARRRLPTSLRDQIDDAGFYPELVIESVAQALADETVVAHLVHHETIFSAELHRHLSVLVLTPTRLLISHTDEEAEDPAQSVAISSIESIGVGAITAVAMTRVVAQPERYPGRGSGLVETWLTINWGTMRRIEIESAHCGDPECEADHGMMGTSFGEDIVVRMSPAADGAEAVDRLIAFGTAMQRVTGGLQ